MDNTILMLTIEEVISNMSKKYYLCDVDYREDLNDHLDLIQKCIRNQSWDDIYEESNEWFWENELDSVDYILNELKSELTSDYSEEEIDSFFEDNRDEITEEIYDRNCSNPLKDLIRHTTPPVCFYDTGVEVYECQDGKEQFHDIKKVLNIPQREKKFDKVLYELCDNASYGGQLVVYFTGDIEGLIDIGDNNTITFNNANIAIIDTCNGSGHNVQLKGHEFSLPFDVTNLFLDKLIKYSYTYQVCGMGNDWCDDTNYHFSKKRSKPNKVQSSSINVHMEYEEKYNRTFKAGGCTAGDMDMNRHRNTYYENNFPCGTHCPQCHTFWID